MKEKKKQLAAHVFMFVPLRTLLLRILTAIHTQRIELLCSQQTKLAAH